MIESRIERLRLSGRSGSDVARWLDKWKAMRRYRWDVVVVTVEDVVREDGIVVSRNVVELVGLACRERIGRPKLVVERESTAD